MRLIRIILFCLLSCYLVVRGQENIILIPYTTSTPLVPSSLAVNALEDIESYLREYDIQVDFVEGDEETHQFEEEPIYFVFHTESVAEVVMNNHAVNMLSPILHHTYINLRTNFSCEECNTTQEISAFVLYAIGDYSRAKNLLTNITNNVEYTRYEMEFILGNINLLEGNYEAAIRHYERIHTIEISPNINLAWTYVQLGNSEAAMDIIDYLLFFHESYNNLETVSELYATRSQLYGLIFDYDRAIADIDEAITIAEENEFDNRTLAELYTIRGEIIFLIYEWDRVEDNLNMAIELDPTYAPAYFQRSVLFYTMARREDALADFETYLELEPDGIYAEEASEYIESIQIELEALGG